MARTRTIKARAHHGARSLDLTIPADVCEKFGVRPGDVFSVVAEQTGSGFTLRYTRVFPE